jgi:hypothetical protein
MLHRSKYGNPMTRARWPIVDFYTALSNLAVESGTVVGLRMLAAVEGGPTWPVEARLMVQEKTKAAIDAQALVMTSLLAGTAASAPSRTLALYRRRVKANRRRLTGKR